MERPIRFGTCHLGWVQEKLKDAGIRPSHFITSKHKEAPIGRIFGRIGLKDGHNNVTVA